MSSNLQYILMPFLLLLIAIYIVAMDAKLVIAAPSRRKPREFLKVTQYEVKETEPSFIPPEEIVQEYEEKDGPEPQLLKHITFKYSSFVLPPPIRLPFMKYATLQQISEYYQYLQSESRGCSEDICINPEKYINVFGNWDCALYPNLCNKQSMLVMAQRKYLVGSLDVIKNGFVSRYLDCGWPANHMESLDPHPDWKGKLINKTVIYLTVPEGLSFQHFIDGVVPKLVQLRDALNDKDSILIMDTTFYDSMPIKLLERIGINETQIQSIFDTNWNDNLIRAKKLILACQVPPLHPKLWQQAQELFRVSWLEPGWTQTRRIVLYLSRGTNNNRNAARRVLNEEELLQSIKPVVEEKNYELVVFNSNDFNTLDTLFDFLANVDVVIGPHGGAFYNILFMRRNITVIEFVQDKRMFHSMRYAVHMIIYLQASLLGDNYYSVVSKSSQKDMIVNIPDVHSILNHCLV